MKLKCNLHPQPPYSLSKEMNFTAVWTSSMKVVILAIISVLSILQSTPIYMLSIMEHIVFFFFFFF